MAAAGNHRMSFIGRWGGLLYGGSDLTIIHFLQGKGLLAVQKICRRPRCQNMMFLERYRCPDGYRWRCKRPCRATLRLRADTFFEPWQDMKLSDLVYSIYLWSQKCKVVEIERLTLLPHDVVIKLCQRLRVCCSQSLVRNPISIGGNGANYVVQIDESQFHHRQRAHRGRIARQPIWVFGMVDTSYEPAKGIMAIVARRDRATLTGVINNHLRANSHIHSDEWRAYINLPQHVPNCVQHDTVNHTYHFVDPITGAHTQHVESYWNRVKLKIKEMRGCRRDALQSYLNEFMWRDWYGGNDHFDSIINAINIDYPQ